MGCFSPSAPANVSYAQTTRDALQAQVDLAPQLYQSEATYQPKYGSLALSNLTSMLNGTPGGPTQENSTVTAGQQGWYDADGNFVSPGQLMNPNSPNGGMPTSGAGSLWDGLGRIGNAGPFYAPGTAPGAGDTWQNAGANFDISKTVQQPAQPGLTAILAQQASSQRASDIADVSNLGPQARAAVLAANPDQAALLGKLNTEANSELDAGSTLTPDQIRAMQQASRAAFAARGMGGGNASISDELLRQYNLGNQMLMQRQGFAQSVLGNNQQIVGDPFQSILGRPSSAFGQAQSVQSGAGPALFNPQSTEAASIAAGNQGYAAAFADPSTIDKIGGVMGITGKLIGGIASAAA